MALLLLVSTAAVLKGTVVNRVMAASNRDILSSKVGTEDSSQEVMDVHLLVPLAVREGILLSKVVGMVSRLLHQGTSFERILVNE